MTVYPISLSTTALLIFLAVLYYRPARRNEKQQQVQHLQKNA